jgi:hypothetical protein
VVELGKPEVGFNLAGHWARALRKEVYRACPLLLLKAREETTEVKKGKENEKKRKREDANGRGVEGMLHTFFFCLRLSCFQFPPIQLSLSLCSVSLSLSLSLSLSHTHTHKTHTHTHTYIYTGQRGEGGQVRV